MNDPVVRQNSPFSPENDQSDYVLSKRLQEDSDEELANKIIFDEASNFNYDERVQINFVKINGKFVRRHVNLLKFTCPRCLVIYLSINIYI